MSRRKAAAAAASKSAPQTTRRSSRVSTRKRAATSALDRISKGGPDWSIHGLIHGHASDLEEEHSSVEPVEDPDDDDDSKGKGELSDGDGEGGYLYQADGKRKWRTRLRRRRRGKRVNDYGDLMDMEDGDEVLVEASDDGPYEDFPGNPAAADREDQNAPDEPRLETVTVDEIVCATAANISYLDCLVRTATYYRSVSAAAYADELERLEGDIKHALQAVRAWPMPITQITPVQHSIPPVVPMADGSELRFTNVAQQLGISWRDVPKEEKDEVYDRAVQLHIARYGSAPSRPLMHTGHGLKPVYYYNENTYRHTMLKALQEYKRKQTGKGPHPE